MVHSFRIWNFILLAVIFVGYAGKFGWNYGVASTWVGIGNAVIGSWLAWKVLQTYKDNVKAP